MSLTKSQEIEILKNAAAALGSDSYCGPLLAMLIPQIEQDIKSDIFPEFDLCKVAAECKAMVEAAKAEASAIEKDGRERAVACYTQGLEAVNKLKKNVARDLRDMANRIAES